MGKSQFTYKDFEDLSMKQVGSKIIVDNDIIYEEGKWKI